MVGLGTKERNLEAAFTIGFSVLVFALFYSLVSANGLILGNDPAVHLETAKYFLSTGSIPLSEILWLPPLYHLVLVTFISFTGAVSIEQQMILMKIVTALMDWMLVFSVYLIAAKFFSKKTGVIAASLLLLCFPLYELNSWGGYTSILSLGFMALLFVYLALPVKSIGHTIVAFVLAFSVVLTHQLAAFMLVFILPPFVVVMLLKSQGTSRKALIAALVGGAIAFGIYYLGPMLPYLGDLVSIVFFQLKTMIYQVPAVSSSAFMTYFGFIIFFAFAGLAIAVFELKKRRSLSFYLLLVLAFLVPLFFSQSYMLGFYLPFQWFIYYLLPALAVLAAVTLSFAIDAAFASYSNNRQGWKRNALKILSVGIVVVLVAVALLQFQTLNNRLGEDTAFYSTSDVAAFQAGTWIRQNTADLSAQVAVSQKPGHWFWAFSGLNVTAETDPVINWNNDAECVLDFSYEMQTPLTMTRVYDAKTGISDENYVQMNMAWERLTYMSSDVSRFEYRNPNGTLMSFSLSSLTKTIAMDVRRLPNIITVEYSGPDFRLTETVAVGNSTYPATVTWQVTALNTYLEYPTLYISEYMDPRFTFTKATVPGLLDQSNPLDTHTSEMAGHWAAYEFNYQNVTSPDKIVEAYDQNNQTAFAVKFDTAPQKVSIGALWNRNIDAIRWEYGFYNITAGYTVSVSYQTLAFSLTSYPQLKDPQQMDKMFTVTPEPFEVQSRNFASIIRDNYIVYIVYDVNRFDKKILSTGWVQLVYSNDQYLVLKVKANHPYVAVLEK